LSEEKFTFFKGSYFSQFFPVHFKDDDGVEYNCAEQYMMAHKALLFKDQETYEKIMSETSPYEQKKLGRKVKGYTDDEWNAVARDVVYQGNVYKFSQHSKLKKVLFSTEGTTLVEAAPWDDKWGIGMEHCIEANEKKNWKGTNWLGETLTRVRDDLMGKELLF